MVAVTAGPLWEVVSSVPDPELPPVTIADLGILRSIHEVDGDIVVTITPTYSGCPAVEYIESQIVVALVEAGWDRDRIRVERALSPAWSTDWITAAGREKLATSGISPPRTSSAGEGSAVGTPVRLGPIVCPLCGSSNTSEVSRFGSTACKALFRCDDCAEPFDHVKEI